MLVNALNGGAGRGRPLGCFLSAAPPPPANSLPRSVLYRLLVREVAAFQGHAAQLDAQGKASNFVSRYHQTLFHLDDLQAAQLIEIVIPCAQQVKALDDQASTIIQHAKANYGKLHGVPVPPPPAALADLEARRTAVVLAAADSIAAAFGPAEFASFELLVQKHFGSRHTAPGGASGN